MKKGSKRQDWRTPKYLSEEINHKYGIEGDVCADASNATTGAFLSEKENALSLDTMWFRRSYCNPPYNGIETWIKRAYLAHKRRECDLIVMLLPARMGQRWLRQATMKWGAVVGLITGRVRFLDHTGKEQGSPFEDSMLLIFGGGEREFEGIRSLSPVHALDAAGLRRAYLSRAKSDAKANTEAHQPHDDTPQNTAQNPPA